MSAFSLISVFCDLSSHGRVLAHSQLLRDSKLGLRSDSGVSLIQQSIIDGVLITESSSSAFLSVTHGLRPDGGLLGRS